MFPALVVGVGVLVGSMLCYGLATALLVQVVVRLDRSGYTGMVLWKNIAVMTVVTLIMIAAHLIQIALWAGALVACAEIATLDKAFYLSAQNYTALGYGDIALSERWRLLGPLEAINGLMLFGVSTATVFAVLSRLITHRLHPLGSLVDPPHRPGGRGESVPGS
jgi:hypothetical protein